MTWIDIVLRVLDISSTVLILLGVWGAPRDRRMWWVYCVGCAFLATVAVYNSLWGVAVGGSVSVLLGIRNALYKKDTR